MTKLLTFTQIFLYFDSICHHMYVNFDRIVCYSKNERKNALGVVSSFSEIWSYFIKYEVTDQDQEIVLDFSMQKHSLTPRQEETKVPSHIFYPVNGEISVMVAWTREIF